MLNLKVHQALLVHLDLLVPRALPVKEEGREQRGLPVRQGNEELGGYRGPLGLLVRLVKQQKAKEAQVVDVS